MSDIIPFNETSKLPAFLRGLDIKSLNADLTAHAGGGFPVISIKGKVFAVVRDGERKVLPNPKDPDSPATSIDVVLIKVNSKTSKVWYAAGYQEGVEAAKPDCFSTDGDKPDPSVAKPQAKTCATCRHNVFGSGNNGKGKACSDSIRMAVATPDLINDPYLLRVPPASIRAVGEYGNLLAKRGVGYNMVVTKVGFDMESPTPKLTFKPVGFIDSEATFNAVREEAESDTVAKIIGKIGEPVDTFETEEPAPKAAAPAPAAPKAAAVSKTKTVTEDEVAAAVQAEAVVEKAKAAAKKPEPVEEKKPAIEVDTSDLNLDDLDFDD